MHFQSFYDNGNHNWELPPQQVGFSPQCSEVDIKTNPRCHFKERLLKTWLKVYAFAFKLFVYIKNIVLAAVKETASFMGRLKDVTGSSLKHFSKYGSLFARLGILSILSLLYSLKKMPSHVRNLFEQIKLRDKAGIVMGFVTILNRPLEALEAMISTIGGLSAFGLIPAIAFFGLISIPLSIALLGFEAFTGIYETIQRIIFLKSLPQPLTDDSEEQRKKILEYVNQTIGITEKEIFKIEQSESPEKAGDILRERKIRALTRHADKEVYRVMLNLKNHLEQGADHNTINHSLKLIRKNMVKRIILKGISAGSRVVGIALGVTLACTLAFPFSVFVLPTIAILFVGISLGCHYYEHLKNKEIKSSLESA